MPTASPTADPTASPSAAPTFVPSAIPSASPSRNPTANPTFVPTAAPTTIPTASPTGCFKFVVGYSQKSCTETCNDPELGGNAVCHNEIMQTIDTYDDFASVIASAILLGSPNNPPTSIAHFCGYGVNNFPFANMAAAFAYQQYVALPTPHYIVDNYCYYQPAASGVSPATCDTQLMFQPSQRVCSCAIADCVDTGAFPLPHYRRLEAAG